MIRKVGSRFVVFDSKGKERLGSHRTKKGALQQLAAIELSKQKRG